MKVRLLPGSVHAYTQKGGSWDEKNPDPNSVVVDVNDSPIKGHYINYTNADAQFIAQIDDVVLLSNATYVFVTQRQL